MDHLVTHLRNNIVGYIALAIALGGGGGYALAATAHPAAKTTKLTACVSNKTGTMFLKKSTNVRCKKAHKVIWNITGRRGATGPKGATGAAGPAGLAGPVGPQGPAGNDTGIAGPQAYNDIAIGVNSSGIAYGGPTSPRATPVHLGTGEYHINLTGCTQTVAPVVTPITGPGIPAGAVPYAYVTSGDDIETGYISSSGFTSADVAFNARLAC